MLKNAKKYIENFAIFLVVLSGIVNILISFPHRLNIINTLDLYYDKMHSDTMVMHGMFCFIIGFLLLMLASRLYKRMRMAWIIEILTLCASIWLSGIRRIHIFTPFAAFEIFIVAVLVMGYKDFSRPSSRISLKYGVLISCLSLLLVLFNTVLRLYIMRRNGTTGTFADSLYQSINLLYMMDTDSALTYTRAGIFYAKAAITLNWTCIIASIILILKPLVFNPYVSRREREKARKLVLRYGQNPMSYLALENDKKYFFGSSVDGVIAFTVAADVAVCCGDMICSDEDSFMFLSEFMNFCKQNSWDIMMLNVTDKFLKLYEEAGFKHSKYGEDCIMKLENYDLKGGRIAKVRAAINHANNMGIIVGEYKPNEERSFVVEDEIKEISKKWLEHKGGTEMSFMLGGIGLEDPMDRRYFTARDKDGKMLGFVVFLPYDGGKAYLADVTRRLPDAPQGVLEKIIFDAFMQMRDEGVIWGNLGLCPLANMKDEDHNGIAEKLFDFIYENLNNVYGFKTLHHAKEKYGPTEWQSRYMAYYAKAFTPQLAYSIVKAQNPKGISKYLLTMLKSSAKAKK